MAGMKERNGSCARETSCAARGEFDILPTTRRQQKVIGYMKKMTATIGLAAAIMPPAAPAAGAACSAKTRRRPRAPFPLIFSAFFAILHQLRFVKDKKIRR